MSGGTVAELVKGMHDEAARGMVDVMNRYAAMVRKAADGKLSKAEALTAASIAYEMGLPADRFDRDVAVVKAERELIVQIEADDIEAAASRAKSAEFKARLAELEKAIRQTRMAARRSMGDALNRTQRKVDHATMRATNPHLFKPADELTDTDWNEVRA